jgi:hypothetical protein
MIRTAEDIKKIRETVKRIIKTRGKEIKMVEFLQDYSGIILAISVLVVFVAMLFYD